MNKPVILTPIAEADLENVIEYLANNWSVAVRSDFLNRFEEICETI